MNIFVGNLKQDVSEKDLSLLFGASGRVNSVRIAVDHKTGVSKGYAFVKMPQEKQAREAIARFNGFDFDGSVLEVKETKGKRPKADPNRRR